MGYFYLIAVILLSFEAKGSQEILVHRATIYEQTKEEIKFLIENSFDIVIVNRPSLGHDQAIKSSLRENELLRKLECFKGKQREKRECVLLSRNRPAQPSFLRELLDKSPELILLEVYLTTGLDGSNTARLLSLNCPENQVHTTNGCQTLLTEGCAETCDGVCVVPNDIHSCYGRCRNDITPKTVAMVVSCNCAPGFIWSETHCVLAEASATSSEDDGETSTGTYIAAGVCGGIAVFVAIVIIVYRCCCVKKPTRPTSENPIDDEERYKPIPKAVPPTSKRPVDPRVQIINPPPMEIIVPQVEQSKGTYPMQPPPNGLYGTGYPQPPVMSPPVMGPSSMPPYGMNYPPMAPPGMPNAGYPGYNPEYSQAAAPMYPMQPLQENPSSGIVPVTIRRKK